jgi:hypothetical protein
MQFSLQTGTGPLFAAILTIFASQCVLAQNSPSPAPAAPGAVGHVSKGIPPRATPGEYLSHAQAGTVTIAAEFDQHSVPTPETILSTEDYVAVEVALFGPAGAHLVVSSSDFSLRINGKKAALPAEQFAAVFRNLRDPAYSPPELEAAKENKSSGLSTGGGNQSDLGSTPPPVHIPPEMERAMQLQVQNAALPEGDRVLPVAGLIFFKYGGLTKGIHSVELLYAGPAGKVTLTLQP